MPTLTARHSNAFDDLRLLAALAVFTSHSMLLSWRWEPPLYPMPPDASWYISLGGVAVSVFFAISGFLVAASFERTRDVSTFVDKRIARVVPGYGVNALVVMLLLGPVLSTLPIADYLRALPAVAAKDWLHFPRLMIPPLPGLFESNPIPRLPNSSLWTLQFEVLCYGALILVAKCGWLRQERYWIVLAALGMAAIPGLPSQNLTAAMVHCAVFATGAGLYLYRDRFVLQGRVVVLLAVVNAVFLALSICCVTLYIVTVATVTIWLGLKPGRLGWITRRGDYSYGIYLYAWPMQQAFVHLLGADSASFPFYVAGSLVCTLLAAIVSWHLVEQPAMRWMRRLHDLRRSEVGEGLS